MMTLTEKAPVETLRRFGAALTEADFAGAVARILGEQFDRTAVLMVSGSLTESIEHERLVASPQFAGEPRLRTLLDLFRWRRPVDVDTASRCLDPELLSALQAAGVLEQRDRAYRMAGATALFYAQGVFVVVGFKDPENMNAGSVYIGDDTFALLEHLPPLPGTARVLDICTGSGMLGLRALRGGAATTTAVDLSPFACAVAALNAQLNDLDRAFKVHNGSMLEPVAGEGPFDLILCNPPFIPVPQDMPFALFGASGTDGLEHLRALLGGAHPLLAPGGRILMVLDIFGPKADSPEATPCYRDTVALARAHGYGGTLHWSESGPLDTYLEINAESAHHYADRQIPLATCRRAFEELYRSQGFAYRFPTIVIDLQAGVPSSAGAVTCRRHAPGT